MTTKVWTAKEIASKIATDQKWLEHAIVALWKRQTSDEQATRETRHLNNRGFSAAHAKHLTRAANWINSGHHLDGRYLERAREMTSHYVGQLVEIANGR